MKKLLSRRSMLLFFITATSSKLLGKSDIKPGTVTFKSVTTSGILHVNDIDIVTNKLEYTIYGDGHSHNIAFNEQSFNLLKKHKEIIVRSDFGNKQDHSHWVKVKLA